MASYDVIIVGGEGNAGYTAATTTAQELLKLGIRGGRVLLIEKSPQETYAGGNSMFTAGATRTVLGGLDDILTVLPPGSLDRSLIPKIDVEPYPKEAFMSDLMRVTSGRADPSLARVLVEESRDTVGWLASIGIPYRLSFNRQAYAVGDRFRFWGGMSLATIDGGKGLMKAHHAAAERHGVEVAYGTSLTRILTSPRDGTVTRIEVSKRLSIGGTSSDTINCNALILACGGFEANPAMRAQYLGPGWDMAHTRGTPYNTGDGLLIAQRDVNAKFTVCWDANSPRDAGDLELTNQYTKSGYPLGIMVNTEGFRFVDEGIDFRNYTYAYFGRELLKQPGGVAWQLWDQKSIGLLRSEEYSPDVVERIEAQTIEELAMKLTSATTASKVPYDKIDRAFKPALSTSGAQQLVQTVREYNEAVRSHRRENPTVRFDPSVLDGCGTVSLSLPKSNWALTIDEPPFLAVKITTGVTFTFGGLAVDSKTSTVLNNADVPVRNLFAAGEIVGGTFVDNYPGGSGLTVGSVLGRKAGISASLQVAERRRAPSL